MKKKILIPVIIVVAIVLILFVPVPTGKCEPYASSTFTSLMYKIVNWDIDQADVKYEKTVVYWIPHNFDSVEDIWNDIETDHIETTIIATVTEVNGDEIVVEEVRLFGESAPIRYAFEKPLYSLQDPKVGDVVEIVYNGGLMAGSPARINAVSWELSKDLRHLEYTGEEWMDKAAATKKEDRCFDDYIVTEVYSDCFFAQAADCSYTNLKVNGYLNYGIKVDDHINCTCENVYYYYIDSSNEKYEADLVKVSKADDEIDPDENYVAKPVLYLYPEEKTEASVALDFDGELTCTYPKYNEGWRVTADTDGTLTDENGKTYNYLYWEGKTDMEFDFSKGFCVKGEDTAEFLESALAKLGLTRKEANEFIVYWLPLMENNEYNIISFQGDNYTEAAKLNVTPNPDTVIRVFMAWQKSEEFVEIEEQTLEAPERTGFTVVEWGGSEIDNSASN